MECKSTSRGVHTPGSGDTTFSENVMGLRGPNTRTGMLGAACVLLLTLVRIRACDIHVDINAPPLPAPSTAPTSAPTLWDPWTPAPTPTTPPTRPTSSQRCGSSIRPCPTIQTGIDQAQRLYQTKRSTVCVAPGTYGCNECLVRYAYRRRRIEGPTTCTPDQLVAAVVYSNISLLGQVNSVGDRATIDCQGSGTGFFISPQASVRLGYPGQYIAYPYLPDSIYPYIAAPITATVNGFHFQNAHGYGAGGIFALLGRSDQLTITACMFDNCTGSAVGGVAVSSLDAQNNSVTISQIVVRNCHSGVGWVAQLEACGLPRMGSGGVGESCVTAGGIGLFFNSMAVVQDNRNTLKGIEIYNCTAPPQPAGYMIDGSAGGIQIDYFSVEGGAQRNLNHISDVTINRSSGGNRTKKAGAGGLLIAYSVLRAGVAVTHGDNQNILDAVDISECTGGVFNTFGGAGGYAASYFALLGATDTQFAFINNTDVLRNSRIIGNSGGDDMHGAGGVAFSSVFMGCTNCQTGLYNLLVQNSTFERNNGGLPCPRQSSQFNTGTAGAMSIKLSGGLTSWAVIEQSRFHSNGLDPWCYARNCLSGAVAAQGLTVVLNRSVLSDNFASSAGALFLVEPSFIYDSTFSKNSGRDYGSIRSEAKVSAVNTSFVNTSVAASPSLIAFSPNSTYTLECEAAGTAVYAKVEEYGTRQYGCKPCERQTYNLAAGAMKDGQPITFCRPCPTNNAEELICPGSDTFEVQPGYFLNALDSQDLSVAKCPRKEACKGGTFDPQRPEIQCKDGYHGLVCAQCDSGWYAPRLEALKCLMCPDNSLSILFAVVQGAGLYALAIYSAKGRAQLGSSTDSEFPSLLKMLMMHATVLSTISSVDWGLNLDVKSVVLHSSSASGSITSLQMGCLLGWDFTRVFYFNVIWPFVVSAAVLFISWAVCLCSKSPFGAFEDTFGTLAVLGIYTFMPAALACMFQVFPCFETEQGKSYMAYAPDSTCWQHDDLTAVAVIVIAVFVLAAGYKIGYGLLGHRDVILEAMVDGDDESHRAARQQYGFLTVNYKPELYMWELWTFTRKCTIPIIATTAPGAYLMSARTLLLLVLVSFSLVLQVHCRPYLDRTTTTATDLHFMDIMSQSCSLLSLLLAQYAVAQGGDAIAACVFIGINVLLAGFFIALGARPAARFARSKWAKLAKMCLRDPTITKDDHEFGAKVSKASVELEVNPLQWEGDEDNAIQTIVI